MNIIKVDNKIPLVDGKAIEASGGGAPVINPLSVTENGTYNAPSGVDGYAPVTVNVPQGITPTGNINITDTTETDVTNYATAQVVDADLIASNIKKDVNILGIIGTFEGGTEITDGIVVKARDADERPTEIDFYGSIVGKQQFYNYSISNGGYIALQTIDFKTNVMTAKVNCFRCCGALTNLPETITSAEQSAFEQCKAVTEINMPELMTVSGGNTFGSCSSLVSAYFPKLTSLSGNYIFSSCSALQTIQIGSVGNSVTSIPNTAFSNCKQDGLTATVFTNGAKVDSLLTAVRNGATNATIIIKASEDTTYNGETYLAGETIITSTPT